MPLTHDERIALDAALDAMCREVDHEYGHHASMFNPYCVTLSRMLDRHDFHIEQTFDRYTPVCSCGHPFGKTYATERGALNALRRHAGLPPIVGKLAKQLAFPH